MWIDSLGLSTALVEMDDFSSGTSSRSTKLIHGGVRYLQKAIMKLDREQVRPVDSYVTKGIISSYVNLVRLRLILWQIYVVYSLYIHLDLIYFS